MNFGNATARRPLLAAVALAAGLLAQSACPSSSPTDGPREDRADGGEPDEQPDGRGDNTPPRVEIERDDEGRCQLYFIGDMIPSRKAKYSQGVEANFRYYDDDGDRLDIILEYSRDNGLIWRPASLMSCSRAKKGFCIYRQIPSDGEGSGSAFAWDVYRDLGPLGTTGGPPVSLRLTAYDPFGPGEPDRCDEVVVPPRPGNTKRFRQFEQPTFVTMAQRGYTAFFAHIPSEKELALLAGDDGMPGTYDDLLQDVGTFQNPVYVLIPFTDDLDAPGMAMGPLGGAALFVRAPTSQINGGGGEQGHLLIGPRRVLPGEPGYSPLWTNPTMLQLAGPEVLQVVRSRAEPFFENGRRFVNLDPQVVSLEPDRDGDLLSDAALRLDGTRIARCVDRGPDGKVVAPCLETPPPPVLPTPTSFVPKGETDPEACLANLPTFAQMVARGYNAIAVDIVASVERSLRLGGGDGDAKENGVLVFNPALRDVAGSNPDPQFRDGIAYWYPGANDPCAEGVGRAPDGRPAFYLTVPAEDRNNRGATVIDIQTGRINGGGFLESNVARPLPGEPGFSPLFNVPATWEELRDITRATSGCALADAYWSGATVYLSPEELAAGTKGPDADGDGCADTITIGGKTLTR